jgi:ribosomal protein S18 acetylase RimI-like enzyme
VAGFTVCVLHPGSWTIAPACYLEDLYVDPDLRGHGIGRALIEDLIGMARDNGWSRIYWHTRQSNEAARRLYDKFAEADDSSATESSCRDACSLGASQGSSKKMRRRRLTAGASAQSDRYGQTGCSSSAFLIASLLP